MKLINVLDSELREEALRRWKVAKEVAKRVDGVIYGSMAAMMVAGLPRLPRDADIAVNWGLDEFLEWFRKFEQEEWHSIELTRAPKTITERGGPRYVLVLWEKDYKFFVSLTGMKKGYTTDIGDVHVHFSANIYVKEKLEKLATKAGTILDVLDLLYYGVPLERILERANENGILQTAKEYERLVPRENKGILAHLLKTLFKS